MREQYELRHLVNQAWQLKHSPYLTDACAAIEQWWDEAQQRRAADFYRVSRRSYGTSSHGADAGHTPMSASFQIRL